MKGVATTNMGIPSGNQTWQWKSPAKREIFPRVTDIDRNNTIEPSFTGDPFDGMLESPSVSEKIIPI